MVNTAFKSALKTVQKEAFLVDDGSQSLTK